MPLAAGVLPIAAFQQLAFVLAAGLLIDAFIVRTVLTPAVMSLVGERSNWPSHRLDAPQRARVPGPEPRPDPVPRDEGPSEPEPTEVDTPAPPVTAHQAGHRALTAVGVAVLGVAVAVARRHMGRRRR